MRRYRALLRDLPLSLKLLLSYSSVFVVTMLVGGLVIYSFVRTAIESNIESELKNSTATILSMVRTTANSSMKNHLRAVAEQNLQILKYIYKKQQAGQMTEAQAKSLARGILLCQTIGTTGYLYCVDSNGKATVHPNRGVEGGTYLQHEFIRDVIKRKKGYLEYNWKNPGEEEERPKALYMTYFAPWDWIISVSSYREEFMELVKVSDFRDNILALRFGKTGYSFLLDGEGNPVIHPFYPGRSRDIADGETNQLIRDVCRMKKGKLIYSRMNPGDEHFRDKLVIFNYIPEFDWIVGSAYYLEESYAPLNKVKNIIFATVLGTLLLVLPITLVISGSILKPLKSLMDRFAEGKSGDLTVRMEVTSKDEVGQLAMYFNDFMEKLEAYKDKVFAEFRERKQTEEALRESESKYRTILERIQEGYYELDMDGRFTFFNNSLQAILGYSEGELRNMNIAQIADQSSAETIAATFDTIKESGSATRDSGWKLIRKDGSVCSVETSVSLIDDKDGNRMGFRGVLRDVTGRKRAEEALRLSEEMFSKAFRCSPSGMIIASLSDGKLINVNDSFLRSTGFTLDQLKGKSLLTPGFILDATVASEVLQEVSLHLHLSSRDLPFTTASGDTRSGVISAELVELWGERHMLAALQDVTDSRRMEREILKISERAHQSIGRDLHDDLCPHLIGVEVLSKVLEQKLSNKRLTEAKDALRIQTLIQDSIKKLRRLSRGLCPVDLEEEGFESSLASLGIFCEDIFGVTYHFRYDSPSKITDETMATHLYYIAHEAVHNAAKHSGGRNIFVTLTSFNGTLELKIRDDGKGIDMETVRNGMGLRIMKYRARRIGATIEVKKDTEGGTLISLKVNAG